MRLLEVEIHHVDLNVGYTPQDWPADFVARLLAQSVGELSPKVDSARTLTATDTGYTAVLGTGDPVAAVAGPAAALTAWLIGRSPGTGLSGDLPSLGAWK